MAAEVVPLRQQQAEPKPEVGKYTKMFDEARDALEDCRTQAGIDRDYYDGNQWTPEERATLAKRKQPIQTYNLTRVAINGMVGIVERTQTDPKAWPRNGPDEGAAELATQTLRFVADENRLDRLKVKAARDYFVEGVCAAIIEAVQEEPDYAVTMRRIPWKEFFFDPFSQEEDFTDARYMGVAKWMDEDDVREMYPDEGDAVANSYEGAPSQSESFADRPNRAWADRRRKRLMVVEMYHREKGAWFRCVFVKGGVLEYAESAYKDDKGRSVCPIEAQSFAKDRENMPYGAVRDLRSPQDGYNRRQSKLLHMLNVRQTFGTKSAAKDVDAIKSELARPDGHIEIEHGEFGRDFGVLPVTDQVAGQFQLLMEARQQMERLLPSKGVIGRQEQGNSGRAMAQAQDAGMTELADPLGGLADWELRILRQLWARAKQYWTQPRWLRVTDNAQAAQLIQINGPDGQSLGEVSVDITLDVVPESATMREAQFQLLGELVKMGRPVPTTAIIEASDLRNKAEIIQQIQQQEQAAAQQPNPELLKLQGDAAKAHEDQNIERERLALDKAKAADDHAFRMAQIEVEKLKLANERERLASDERKANADREVQARTAHDGNTIKREGMSMKAQGNGDG